MHIKTILNKCHKFKRFVYGRAFFVEHEGKQAIYVEILPRKNSAGILGNLETAYLFFITKRNTESLKCAMERMAREVG